MKTIAKAIIVVYTMLGFASLASAILNGATWHFYTAGLCAIMVLVGLADLRKCRKQQP